MTGYVHACSPVSFMSVIISQRSCGIFNIEEFDKKQTEVNRNWFLRQNHKERHSKDDRQENNLIYCSFCLTCVAYGREKLWHIGCSGYYDLVFLNCSGNKKHRLWVFERVTVSMWREWHFVEKKINQCTEAHLNKPLHWDESASILLIIESILTSTLCLFS